MLPILWVCFVIADGLTRNNIAPEGASGRGILVFGLAFIAIMALHYAGARIEFPGAALFGVLAAYTISESYHKMGGVGLSTWLIYAGVYFAQGKIRRDWQSDLARAGALLGALVLLAAPAGPFPGGALNRNMIAGALLAMAPAAWGKISLDSKASLVMAALVMGGIIATGSRGAILSGVIAALFMARPWRYLGEGFKWMSAPSVAALFTGLLVMRPQTFVRRLQCAQEVVAAWMAKSPEFGLGPGFRIPLSWGEHAINAHSVYVTLFAVSGFFGAAIIGLAAAALSKSPKLARWQWGTLVACAAHAIVEENLSWWPVGIVLALALVERKGGNAEI